MCSCEMRTFCRFIRYSCSEPRTVPGPRKTFSKYLCGKRGRKGGREGEGIVAEWRLRKVEWEEKGKRGGKGHAWEQTWDRYTAVVKHSETDGSDPPNTHTHTHKCIPKYTFTHLPTLTHMHITQSPLAALCSGPAPLYPLHPTPALHPFPGRERRFPRCCH